LQGWGASPPSAATNTSTPPCSSPPGYSAAGFGPKPRWARSPGTKAHPTSPPKIPLPRSRKCSGRDARTAWWSSGPEATRHRAPGSEPWVPSEDRTAYTSWTSPRGNRSRRRRNSTWACPQWLTCQSS